MLTREFAEKFATDWIGAWNSHDLARVLEHYADDFEMESPVISDVASEPTGKLSGKAAVGAYWAKALRLIPDLHFELHTVFLGAESVAVHYTGPRGKGVEVFFFDATGKVIRAAAHYA